MKDYRCAKTVNRLKINVLYFVCCNNEPWLICNSTFIVISLHQNMCHENKTAVCRVVVRNFGRDGGRPTTFGEQALIANHFMLL